MSIIEIGRVPLANRYGFHAEHRVFPLFTKQITSHKRRMFARVRSFTNEEKAHEHRQTVFAEPENNAINVQAPLSGTQKFVGFDRVFDENTTNKDMFDATMQNFVDDMFRGQSGLLLADGSANSGKVQSMAGNDADAGIIVRTVHSIYSRLDSIHQRTRHLAISAVEVHDEKVYNLIGPKAPEQLRLDRTCCISSTQVPSTPIRTSSSAVQLLKSIMIHRHATAHQIISIQFQDGMHDARLNICLLGSNKGANGGSSPAQNNAVINLHRCLNIQQWNQAHPGEQRPIPFGHSKLTRLLRLSLIESTPIIHILHLAPGPASINSSLKALSAMNDNSLLNSPSKRLRPIMRSLPLSSASSDDVSSDGSPKKSSTPSSPSSSYRKISSEDLLNRLRSPNLAFRRRRLKALKFIRHIENVISIHRVKKEQIAAKRFALAMLNAPVAFATLDFETSNEFGTMSGLRQESRVVVGSNTSTKDLESSMEDIELKLASLEDTLMREADVMDGTPRRRPRVPSWEQLLPPVWVPDDIVKACVSCMELFWMLRRRHHCRACGLVVCHYCCNHLQKLPWLSAPERVCKLCIAARSSIE